MITRKYTADYRLENEVDPATGKLVTHPVYRGDWYAFTSAPARIAGLKKLYAVGVGLAIVLFVAAFATKAPVTRQSYVLLPFAALPIPLYYALAGTKRLWDAKGKVTREHCDKIHNRLSAVTLFLVILTACSACGHVVSWCLNGETLRDLGFLFATLLLLADSVVLFHFRSELKMEKCGSAKKEE